MSEDVIFGIADGIARITMNRPQIRNAMSREIAQQMQGFCRTVSADPKVRCLMITGAGEHFMAGGNAKAMMDVLDYPDDQLRSHFQDLQLSSVSLWQTLQDMPQPVVCSVRGFAAGAALAFVAGADLTIASTTAKFLLAHVNLGLSPDGSTTYHLARTVGLKAAKQMAFFGDRIDADEALRLGLVNWVVPDEALEAKTEEVLQRLAAGATTSISRSKALLNASLDNSLSEQLVAEAIALGNCAISADFKEGVRAFSEKRKAAFTGR